MKLSISLPEEDVALIDRLVAEHGIASRSAVLQRALDLLRARTLGDAYAAAWAEWDDDGGDWDVTVDDGLSADA